MKDAGIFVGDFAPRCFVCLIFFVDDGYVAWGIGSRKFYGSGINILENFTAEIDN